MFWGSYGKPRGSLRVQSKVIDKEVCVCVRYYSPCSMYSAVLKYLDSDTVSVRLGLYSSTMDFN